jgi:hypothetical protein
MSVIGAVVAAGLREREGGRKRSSSGSLRKREEGRDAVIEEERTKELVVHGLHVGDRGRGSCGPEG